MGTKGGGVWKRQLSEFGIALGVKETVNNKTRFNIYPNPFTSSSILHIEGDLNANKISLVIYDLIGKEVKRLENIKENNVIIDRINLIDGIYFYKLLENNKIIATGKLVAE